MSYITKIHFWYYAGLVAVFVSSLMLLIYFSYSKDLQMMIGLFMAIFYVGWGLLHHYVHHDIHPKIVLEYVLFAVIGVGILYFTLYLAG